MSRSGRYNATSGLGIFCITYYSNKYAYSLLAEHKAHFNTQVTNHVFITWLLRNKFFSQILSMQVTCRNHLLFERLRKERQRPEIPTEISKVSAQKLSNGIQQDNV